MEEMSSVEVQTITAGETWALRRAVLRPGHPLPAARFPGDDLPSTKHFGTFQAGKLVGITSLFLAEMPECPGERAWQLRGMATAPEVRGAGFGRALVAASVACARESGMTLLWCNARTSAVGFYRKLGWEIAGAEFDIPDVGPHFRMWRRIA